MATLAIVLKTSHWQTTNLLWHINTEQKKLLNVAEVQLSYKQHFNLQERHRINSYKQAYDMLISDIGI